MKSSRGYIHVLRLSHLESHVKDEKSCEVTKGKYAGNLDQLVCSTRSGIAGAEDSSCIPAAL